MCFKVLKSEQDCYKPSWVHDLILSQHHAGLVDHQMIPDSQLDPSLVMTPDSSWAHLDGDFAPPIGLIQVDISTILNPLYVSYPMVPSPSIPLLLFLSLLPQSNPHLYKLLLPSLHFLLLPQICALLASL